MRKNIKYRFFLCTLYLVLCTFVHAGNVYYVSTTGSDTNAGTKDAPFATLNKAHEQVQPGDTVYFRGGTYLIAPSQIMTPSSTTGTGQYTYVFDLNKKGNDTSGRIVYAGYPGERPVFDFSQILPETRIVGFYLHASYVHLKNFDITGIKATLHGHYQCECVAARNGSYCITENVAMYNNMAIGYYATKGNNNLVLNCDAYNNFDDYSAFKNDSLYNVYKTTGTVPSGSTSETLGGNCDGFGFHATRETDTCNVFRGCRAWWNSDDGFDCINSKTAVVWDSCWAFYNGYKPGSNSSAGDGNGFKAGGYGMSTPASGMPEGYIPQNIITNCVAFYNKSNGFYANHHLGGNLWENNTAMWNWKNYDFTNRKEANTTGKAEDTKGYGHIIRNNVSFAPMDGSNKDTRHFSTIDSSKCELDNNVIAVATDFLDCTRLSYTQLAKIALCNPRQADGSLPYTPFLRAAASSSLYANHQGALFEEVYQTIAAYANGSVTAGEFTPKAEDGTSVSLAYSTRYNHNTTACTAITFTQPISVVNDVPTDRYVKVTPTEGGFLAGDKISFQPFTQLSTDDYTGTQRYGNILVYGGSDSEVEQLYATAATAEDKSDVTDGHEQEGDVKEHTFTLSTDCDALYFGRTGNTRVSVLSFVVTRIDKGPSTISDVIDTGHNKAQKILENGRIIIIRGDTRYDILGHVL